MNVKADDRDDTLPEALTRNRPGPQSTEYMGENYVVRFIRHLNTAIPITDFLQLTLHRIACPN